MIPRFTLPEPIPVEDRPNDDLLPDVLTVTITVGPDWPPSRSPRRLPPPAQSSPLPPEDDPPPVPPRQLPPPLPRKKRTWKSWLVTVLLILLLIVAFPLIVLYVLILGITGVGLSGEILRPLGRISRF